MARKPHKNPYGAKTEPRQYSAWYHKHHPGYFAEKANEWLGRKPTKARVPFFATRNKKGRVYINVYKRLSRRLRRPGIHRALSFTQRERKIIEKSDYLTEMHQEVRARHARILPTA